MYIPLHDSQHSSMLVRVKVHMKRDRLMLMQSLVLANDGEERFAVHEAHIVHDPPGDSRILVIPMGRKENDLHNAYSGVRAVPCNRS